MEQGAFNTYHAPVGFTLIDGDLQVNQAEVPTIQRIFTEYLSGNNSREIAAALNKDKALGRHWRREAIDYILQNERYAGNALLQKRYTTDSFPREKKRNRGEREKFFVFSSNEAIISQEMFDQAQQLRKTRKREPTPLHDTISRQIRCSCGARVRAKKINQKWCWCCCNHEERHECQITPIPEIQVQKSFCRLYYKLKHQSIPILEQMLTNLQMVRNRRMLWSPDIVALNKRISDISSQNQTLAFLKQQGLVDPDIFIAKTNELTKQLRQVKLEKEKLVDAESDMTALQTRDLIDILEDGPEFLDSFDTELFGELVEKIIIESNDSVRFCLKNGLELRESIERTVR